VLNTDQVRIDLVVLGEKCWQKKETMSYYNQNNVLTILQQKKDQNPMLVELGLQLASNVRK